MLREAVGIGRAVAAVGAIGAPVLAFVLTRFFVDGHAQESYFDAVSQILPVLLLALAVEQRYFSQVRQPAPAPLPENSSLISFYRTVARIYALVVLVVLGFGEWVAVEVLATGSSSTADLKNTAGSLAAGFTALIVTAMVGTKQTGD